MLSLKMAFRDLWRRKFRTVLTLLALGLSYAMLIVFKGMSDGGHEQWAELAIRLSAGHVVVQGKGYNQQRILDLRVVDPAEAERVVRKLDPNIRVAFRIFTSGSLRSADGSVMLHQLMGVEAGREAKVSDIPSKIKSSDGGFLTGSPGEMVIGCLAARKLKVRPGDKVVLTASGLSGRVQEQFRIKGIFKTGGTSVDTGYAAINLAQAQRMLGMGGSVTQVAVFADLKRAASLARRLGKAMPATANVEVLDWEGALPMLSQLIWLDDASMYVFLLIIFGIVAAGVVNAILMSVMERTRQFGVLKALGMMPSKIVGLIMTEAAIIGVISVAIGFAVGLPLNEYFTVHGLNISAIMGDQAMEAGGVALTDRMYSKLYPFSILWTSLSVLGLTLLAALYPAVRAARIIPVRAIHRA